MFVGEGIPQRLSELYNLVQHGTVQSWLPNPPLTTPSQLAMQEPIYQPRCGAQNMAIVRSLKIVGDLSLRSFRSKT